jgi:hypothetical protein
MGLGSSRLKKELWQAQREIEIRDQKITYEYWHCIKDVWRFDLSGYDDCFAKGLKLCQHNIVQLYQDVHHDLMNGEGIETYLQGKDVYSVFSVDLETVVTADTDDLSQREDGNRKANQKHAKDYLKNILGDSVAVAEKS